MKTRHRVPSIFNLSMVDVLCCALGCVILLWLLNLRNAHEQAEQATHTDEELNQVRQELAATMQDRDGLRSKLDETTTQMTDLGTLYRALQARFDETTKQADATQKRLTSAEEMLRSTSATLTAAQKDRDSARDERDAARKEIGDLNKMLAGLKDQKKDVEERLARQVQDFAALDKKMTAASQRITTLEGQVRDKDALASGSAKKADDLAVRLADTEARAKKLEPLVTMVAGLQDDVKKYRDQFTKEEALAKALEKEIKDRLEELAAAGKGLKDLEAAKRGIEGDLAASKADRTKLEERLIALLRELEERKKDLAAAGKQIEGLRTEADRARAAVDNRFAGITLTGRRVIFLVDMSGSMDRVDKETLAPTKWQGVRETAAKILRSLPEVEKFQVIVFSEQASFLLGQEGRWLDYDPKTSPDAVTRALAATRPEGGTNLYAALEAAFKFRPQGLDTIYLLSDGLPNQGEGLTPEQDRTLGNNEREEVLGKYLRRVLQNSWNRAQPGQPRVRINGVGFFYESPSVGAFLWALARENDGSFVGMSKP